MRKLACFVLTVGACILVGGCARPGTAGPERMYRMGERVEVGPMTYIILHSEWLDQLGDGPSARLPKHRFLAVRLSVTNGGASTANVPTMTLASASGAQFSEIEDASALPQWLGFIRTLKAADTLHGRVLFDAPPGDYQLKLSSGSGDPDNEIVVTVDLPLQFGQPRIPAGASAQQ